MSNYQTFWFFFVGQPHEGASTEEHPGNLTILLSFCLLLTPSSRVANLFWISLIFLWCKINVLFNDFHLMLLSSLSLKKYKLWDSEDCPVLIIFIFILSHLCIKGQWPDHSNFWTYFNFSFNNLLGPFTFKSVKL